MFGILVEIITEGRHYESWMDDSGNADLRKQSDAFVSWRKDFVECSCRESVKINYVI
jgi:hypothetical protein